MGPDPVGSYLTLEPGADVETSDGRTVGTVEHVLKDEESDIFDGLVVDIRTGPGGLRFVDAPQVAEIRGNVVVLSVPVGEIDDLPKPEANPAVMESHGVEDSEGRLEHKLRRAWEIISGRG